LKTGKVYLVGAGPGDSGLLTLKGLETIKKADVIIHDRLISKAILSQIPARTKRIYVGKSPKGHPTSQDAINKVMIEEASKGKTVVRLKGGDPFIFGRGGEEAQFLRRASIPFEIVPGMSSAHAAPAYAGIPLTHRDHSSSVAIVTGHEGWSKDGKPVDWKRLAKAADTLVVLMGVSTLPSIVEALIRGGRSKDTPIAVIEKGTTSKQRVTTGVLADIVAKVNRTKVKPPAVIVVGEVVKLRDELAWFRGSKLESKR